MGDAPPPVWHGLLAGGCAAVTSRLITYPPDLVKARLQVQGSGPGAQHYRSTGDAFLKISQAEGIRGFYRGFAPILATVVPANMSYFGGYELGKRLAPQNMGVLTDMCTALIAQTIAGVCFNPIDIIKQKLQTAAVQHGRSIGAMEAVRDVYSAQGLPGFWKGFVTMNVLWLPWNLVYLTLYEAAKRRLYYIYLQRGQAAGDPAAAVSLTPGLKGGEALLPASVLERAASSRSVAGVALRSDPPMHEVLPFWAFPLCSGLCSATASVATQPIDVVKTRLQVLSTGAQSQGLNAWGVAAALWREEGLRGFRRGMAARTMTMAAGSAVSWTTYESVKKRLARWRAAQQAQQD